MKQYFKKTYQYFTTETEFDQSIDRIRQALAPEQHRLLIDLLDAHSMLLELGARAAYARGFRLGSKVVADAFR